MVAPGLVLRITCRGRSQSHAAMPGHASDGVALLSHGTPTLLFWCNSLANVCCENRV